jgi:hypothetical protein
MSKSILTKNLLLVAGKVDGLDTADLLGSKGSSGELLDSSGASSVQSSAQISALLDGRALGLLQCSAEGSAGSARRHVKSWVYIDLRLCRRPKGREQKAKGSDSVFCIFGSDYSYVDSTHRLHCDIGMIFFSIFNNYPLLLY